MSNNRKAIIYTRVSTEEQKVNGASLRYQEEQLRKYCDRKNLEIIAHYEDDVTGTNTKRDNYRAMFEWVFKNGKKVDFILVTRSDRFMRNLLEMLTIQAQLRKLGVKFIAIEQERDDSSPESVLIETLQYSMDELESKKTSIRVKDANYKFAKEGAFLNTPPFGYSRLRIDKKATLIESADASTVRQIYTLFAEGTYSTEALRKKLGLSEFSKQGFINILRNKTYIGLIKVPAFKEEKEYWIRGLHEPIINQDLFETVQAILNGKRPSPIKAAKKGNDFFLRGHVICPKCNHPFTASRSKGRTQYYAYYHCDSKYGCNHRFTKAEFEENLLQLVSKFEVKNSVEKLYRSILSNTIEDDTRYKAKKVTELKKSLDELVQKEYRNQDLLIEGKINDVTFNAINNRFTAEKSKLELELSQLQQTSNTDLQPAFEKGLTVVKSLKRILLEADAEDKSRIVGSIFPKKLTYSEGEYRTTEINAFIMLICPSIKGLDILEKEKATENGGLSSLAPRPGLEPGTPRLTVLCSNQLSYRGLLPP